MTTITGYTITELIEHSGKTRTAILSLLSRHDIKPILPEFLYPLDTLDKIREARRGRPRKPNPAPLPADNEGGGTKNEKSQMP